MVVAPDGIKAARSRGVVWLRRAGFVVLALYGIYLVGANVVLNTPVLRPVISKKPEKLLIEWRSGWTVLPGRVRINGLRIRGQSRKIQWQCRLESGSLRISLTALSDKVVRVSRAGGEGFEFYLRNRLETPEATPAEAGMFPEIEGFSNPPDPKPEDLYSPKTKPKKPWYIDVSRVRFVGPVDLWLDSLRIQGDGRIGGGVKYRIRSEIAVPEVALDLKDAAITIDGHTLARQLQFLVDASIEPFTPKGTKLVEVLGGFKGNVRITDGVIADLGVLRPLFPKDGALQLVGGEGRIDVEISVAEPRRATGSVEVVVNDAKMLTGGLEILGNINVDARLAHGDLVEGLFELKGSSLVLEQMRLPDPARERGEAKDQKKAQKLAQKGDAPPPSPDPAGEPGDWWARFEITQGTIDLGEISRLNMQVELAIKDSRPVLNLFFGKPSASGDKTKVPGWVKMVPDIKNIEGTAGFELGPQGTVVDDVVLAGDSFDLLARFRAQKSKAVGQLYVHYKSLHIGVDIQEDKKALKLSKPKDWFVWRADFDAPTPAGPAEGPPADDN